MATRLAVLIIEDSESDADLLVRALIKAGYQLNFEKVESGAQMRAALELQAWDLVISDYSLPQFDGRAALEILRETGLDIPFIVVSGTMGEETAVAMMRAGAHDYLMKGNLARLLPAVERELKQAQVRRERRQAQEDIQLLARFPAENPYPILRISRDGTLLFVNEAGIRLLPEWQLQLGEAAPPQLREAALTAIESGVSRELDLEYHEIVYSFFVAPVTQAGYANLYGRDITGRKRAEESLRQRVAELEAVHTVSATLRNAQTRDEALPILLDQAVAALETDSGAIMLSYPESGDLRTVVARGWIQDIVPPPMQPGEGIAGMVFESGQTYVSADLSRDPLTRAASRPQIPAGWGGAFLPIRFGTTTVGVLVVAIPAAREISPERIRLLESLAEMGGAALHRMQLYEETVRRLQQVQALHSIDQAISAMLDLRMTLYVVIEHVTAQLGVDAACVLLLDPLLGTLEYAAGRGFRTGSIQTGHIRLGESFAGRAALERHTIHALDAEALRGDQQFSALSAAEGFAGYFAVPLIAKGEIKGVLEVFQRAPLNPGPDWVDFLETLAGQAAVAIDNGQLFEGLQRSNIGLTLAYDATIEGWSRALDLRDKETEGHSLRVTELTVRLARAMGLSESELVHIRRGSLLHDIGKMGVPDQILFKPGKLSDEEWVVMRRHPVHAYEMLAPIAYLNPALDIPYSHHEKWDGTGYPRGLQGEAIPLAARIFAVVDVWDALTNDRPYRAAWSSEQALEYIREQSGKHFDPQIVGMFLTIREIE